MWIESTLGAERLFGTQVFFFEINVQFWKKCAQLKAVSLLPLLFEILPSIGLRTADLATAANCVSTLCTRADLTLQYKGLDVADISIISNFLSFQLPPKMIRSWEGRSAFHTPSPTRCP